MEAQSGSPILHFALLAIAVLFLVWETWRGWRAGFARAAVNLIAMVASGTVGILAGQGAAILAGGSTSPLGFLVMVFVGAAVALIMYFGIWIASILLLKRTAQQKSTLLRVLWGSGGALMGFLFGLVILWGGISLIRLGGAMGEGHTAAARSRQSTPPPGTSALVTIRDSLEAGSTGRIFKAADPIPGELYETMGKVTRLTADQDAMLRFIQSPQIQDVISHPVVIGLLNDPEIARAAQSYNLPALLSHPKLKKAAEDPDLAETLRAVDLKAALDYATADPSPPGP